MSRMPPAPVPRSPSLQLEPRAVRRRGASRGPKPALALALVTLFAVTAPRAQQPPPVAADEPLAAGAPESPAPAPAPVAPVEPPPAEQQITIRSGRHEVRFSSRGATPLHWAVHDRRASGVETAETLLDATATGPRATPLGLTLPLGAAGSENRDAGISANQALYRISRSTEPGYEVLRFETILSQPRLEIVRTYRIPAQGFLASLEIALENAGDAPIALGAAGGRGAGLILGPGLGAAAAMAEAPRLGSYTRALVRHAGEVETLELDAETPSLELPAGEAGPEWAGLHSQYFIVALLPQPAAPATGRTASVTASLDPATLEQQGEDAALRRPQIVLHSEPLTLAPGASTTLSYALFIGPKDRHALAAAGRGLEDVPFHQRWSVMAGLCLALQWMLDRLHGLIGSWGAVILVLAILIRVVMFPLSRSSMRAQRTNREVQERIKPEVAAIKERHKGDAVKRNEALMALYKEHGLSTMAQLKGSFPLMIQLPILIALYHLLSGSYDLRGVSFLWIDDLALPDRLFPLGFSLPWLGAHFNLLPFVMFVAQVFIARTMPGGGGTGKKKRNRAIYLMPVVMLVLFYPFPSGCMLYWTLGNLLQILEQRMIFKGTD